MAHRLDPLIQRVHDEHLEYLARGAGVPLRQAHIDAGVIAICGDSEGLDRRGRQAITFVRADRRLTLLTLADEADVDAQCVKYKATPLALVEPYRVFFRGKHREFRATARPFLMGVCDCEGETILVACVDGGLLFCVTVNDGGSRTWARFAEASWAPFDLDNALRIQGGEDPVEQPQPQPQPQRPRAKGRGPSRRVDDCDDEVEEHHERLATGVIVQQRYLSIFKACFEQLHQKAQLPNPAGHYFEGRKETAAVVAGLLKAIANGCGDLGGRESDMRATLRNYGVVIPKGALTAVLRIFVLLGCPLVSQPEPAKGRKASKRWKIEVVAALDPKNPKHLVLLKWIDTPLRKPSAAAAEGPPGEAQEPVSESSETATSTGTKGEAQGEKEEPEAPAREAPGEPADPRPGTRGAAPVDPSAWWLQLSEPVRACIRLGLSTLTLLTQEIAQLHQRLDAVTQGGASSDGRPIAADALDAPDEAGRPDGTATQPTDGHQYRSADVDADEKERVDAESQGEERHGEAQAGGAEGAYADEVIGDEARGVDPDGAGVGESCEAELAREAAAPVGDVGPHVDAGMHVDADQRVDAGSRVDASLSPHVDLDQHAGAHPHEGASPGSSPSSHADLSPHVDAQPHPYANFAGAGPDDPSTSTTEIAHAGPDTDVPMALGRAEWALTLDRWSFATVVFMVMFEVEDPTLVQAVVRSVIAWTAESGGRVDWSGERCWPRALGHSKAGALEALACAERLYPATFGLCAQPECGDTGPRGPPPLGC